MRMMMMQMMMMMMMMQIMMISSPSKVSKQHSIGDGGFQLGHQQANLPLQELRAVQVPACLWAANLVALTGALYVTITMCHYWSKATF